MVKRFVLLFVYTYVFLTSRVDSKNSLIKHLQQPNCIININSIVAQIFELFIVITIVQLFIIACNKIYLLSLCACGVLSTCWCIDFMDAMKSFMIVIRTFKYYLLLIIIAKVPPIIFTTIIKYVVKRIQVGLTRSGVNRKNPN